MVSRLSQEAETGLIFQKALTPAYFISMTLPRLFCNMPSFVAQCDEQSNLNLANRKIKFTSFMENVFGSDFLMQTRSTFLAALNSIAVFWDLWK